MILNRILLRNKLSILGVSLMLLNNISCTGYEDNVNPNEATEEVMEIDNLKMGAFFSQILRRVVIINDGNKLDSDYQITQNLPYGLYSGYIAATLKFTNHNRQYSFQEQWVNTVFDHVYIGIMVSWQSAHKIVIEQELPEVDALATIVKVEGMHRIADTLGPIPYVDYGSSSLYDVLDLVYSKFSEELGNTIEISSNYVNGNVDAKLMSNYDYVYEGDVEKWVKLANTPCLRLAIRVSYANPTLAETQAKKPMENMFGFIESKMERAGLSHNSLEYHYPLHEIAYNFSSDDCRPGTTIITYLNRLNDSRINSYFTVADDSEYHSVHIGITTNNMNSYQGNKISNLNINCASTPMVWITVAESFFLRVESALRGWNMGGTAKSPREQGIRISFEENSTAGVDDYLADYTSAPGAFADDMGGDNYIFSSRVAPAWDDSAGSEAQLEHITIQKWIANHPDGSEGWSEYRHIGYPEVTLVVRNSSSGTTDIQLRVRHLPYTRDKKINNASGAASDIPALNGQDTGGTKLRWDKKSR